MTKVSMDTLRKAQDHLQDTTVFKAELVEQILLDGACNGGLRLSANALQGLYMVSEEIRKDIDLAIDTIGKAIGEARVKA